MKEVDELKLRAQADLGNRAQQLLENPIFKDAFTKVERTLLERLIQAPVRDVEGVHELKLMIQLLRTVQAHIAKMAQTGRMADKELSRWESAKSRVRRAMGGQ